MRSLVHFALARPRAALAVWLAGTLALGFAGLGIEGRVAPSTLKVTGSESNDARGIVIRQFGDSSSVPIMLQGKRATVVGSGRSLVAALSREEGVTVVSPWTDRVGAAGGRQALRPDPGTALVVASVSGTAELIATRAAEVERIARSMATEELDVRVTGTPTLTRAGVESSAAAVHRAELIALPLLLLILLVVFRSPLAAAIPVGFGAGTVAAGYGLLALLTRVVEIDTFALALAAMMGLALAVDYSLLMVSRYREERGRGSDAHDAAAVAAHRTGHTLVVAGAAVVVAMVVGAALSPSPSVLSAAVGVSAVASLAALGASLAIPAVVVLLGSRLVVAARPRAVRGFGSGRALRNPLLAGAVAIGLAALAIPALGLRTASPGAADLPGASQARQDAEAVERTMGPGWAAGFEIVAVARKDAITTPARLGALERMQKRIARDPAVAAVIGPGAIAPKAARLRQAGRLAVERQRELPRHARGLARLDDGVRTTATGVASLRGALTAATGAAGRIDAGSTRVSGGVGKLRDGLRSATGGIATLTRRITGARSGARAVAAGVAAARAKAKALSDQVAAIGRGAAKVPPKARALSDRLRSHEHSLRTAAGASRNQREQLQAALDEMNRTMPRTTGNLRALAALAKARAALAAHDGAAALEGPTSGVATEAAYANSIADGAAKANTASLTSAANGASQALAVLEGRLRELGAGVEGLSSGSAALLEVLRRLGAGTDSMDAGIQALRTGVGGLVDGVRAGERRTSSLAAGIDAARSAADSLREQGGSARRGPRVAADPKFFDSGYFVLAALDGAGGSRADAFGVNVDRGGRAARVLVVPRYGAADPRTRALYDRLADRAHGFASFTGTEAAVGGHAALMIDHERATATSFPLLVLVLTLVTSALIGVLLRSWVVALIGAALNLLTVGATLGMLTSLFGGELDGVAITAIFGVIFALSIDYQVFIVARVREEFLRGGDALAAIDGGIGRTARVVTGAALSMFGVFIAFALSDVAVLRQFGVGLAIAVALDATAVRLMLLPAALRLAGRHAWPAHTKADPPADEPAVQFATA